MGTNSTGCTEWERDFDPVTEQPRDLKGETDPLRIISIVISGGTVSGHSTAVEIVEALQRAGFSLERRRLPPHPR